MRTALHGSAAAAAYRARACVEGNRLAVRMSYRTEQMPRANAYTVCKKSLRDLLSPCPRCCRDEISFRAADGASGLKTYNDGRVEFLPPSSPCAATTKGHNLRSMFFFFYTFINAKDFRNKTSGFSFFRFELVQSTVGSPKSFLTRRLVKKKNN